MDALTRGFVDEMSKLAGIGKTLAVALPVAGVAAYGLGRGQVDGAVSARKKEDKERRRAAANIARSAGSAIYD